MATIDPIIKTEDLSVIYNLGKSNEFTALSGIDIQIYPGEFAVFFGPSGCGKSTLLYCLAGLETASRGEIIIKGKNLAQMDRRRLAYLRRTQIGMIFQAYNLIPTLTVMDNVFLPHIFLESDIAAATEKARSLLGRFGIADLAERYPRDLSGGQQQRVAIARALMVWPPIIYADEPTGNLDTESSKVVMDFLYELNDRDKRTIVLVTHDPAHLAYAHRIFHMQNGRVIREVVNSSRQQISPAASKEPSSVVDAVARAYPGLPETQIKAKALAQYLLTALDAPEIERFEMIIARRIAGDISEEEFKRLLDVPFEEGGVGFYRQTAADFAQKVEKILAEADILQGCFASPASGEDPIAGLRRFLLDGEKVALSRWEQVKVLDELLEKRRTGKIGREEFRRGLDLPEKSGGVGLNRQTAKKLTGKLEIALVKYREN